MEMANEPKSVTGKVLVETLARFVLDNQHPASFLDFDRQVEMTETPGIFLLKIFATDSRLIRVYRVTSGTTSVGDDYQPFELCIMDHFRKFKTDPPENYYFAYILVNKDSQPESLKVYHMPMEFSQL